MEASTEKIVAANGEPLRILGSAALRIRIAGIDREHKVLITDDVNQNCLLGVDFFKQNGCIVDFADGMLRCGGGTTPLRYQTQAPSVCRVAVEKNIALEPSKETVLTARLSSTDTVGVAGVFEPRAGFEAKHQVLMARVVARPTPTGQVPLRVVNLSADRINLYGGQHVGSFCPMAGTCDVVSAPVGAYVEICQVRPCSTQ